MENREALHSILEDILGSKNVYFQPPESVKLKFPCIIYSRNRQNDKRADDKIYLYRKCYSVIVVDKNPDSLIPNKLLDLPFASFDRNYTSDNMNHFVYNIYY